MAASGLLDLIMIRYNAAHRGAERDLFPLTDRWRMPVIAYTALRGGRRAANSRRSARVRRSARLRLVSLRAASPIRHGHPGMPANRAELEEALQVLACQGPLTKPNSSFCVRTVLACGRWR